MEFQSLRRRAEKLQAYSEKRDDSTPFFAEFSGTPKAGKSTCIEIINHFFRRIGFTVLAPAEGASKRTPFYLKENLVAFNTWSVCYALQQVLDGAYSSEPYDIVLLDRGPFDALAWFELLKRRGELESEECQTIQEFLLLDEWRERIGTVFLFYADPETSLQREHEYALIEEPGRAMNTEFLADLNSAYESIRDQHAQLFDDVVPIDTSKDAAEHPTSTAEEVVERILERMETCYGD